jgi:voltage-gated potassium channel
MLFTLKHIFLSARWLLLAIILGLGLTTVLIYAIEYRSPAEIEALLAAGEATPNIGSIEDAFWYTIVTASTVGYGDTFPISTLGRLVGGLYIILTLVSLGAVLGGVTSAVAEANRLRFLGMDGCKFENHLIICGYSRIAEVALAELLASDQKVAVIVEEEDQISHVREEVAGGKNPANLYVTAGDPSSFATLDRANVAGAATVIAASDDDTRNLVTSINIRSRNTAARIIVYIKRDELRTTLNTAGVTYVASPFELSGRLIASAAFEPEVAQLIEDVSSSQGGHDLQQFMVIDGSPIIGKSIKELRETMLTMGGALLLAHGRSAGDNRFNVVPNPPGDIKLAVGDALIVVGDDKQNEISEKYLGCRQGR